jgi:predicted transcriptional regulator
MLNYTSVTRQTGEMQGDGLTRLTLTPGQSARFTARMVELKQLSKLAERELAARGGIPVSTLHSVMVGASDPKLSTMLGLMRAFELRTLDELLAAPPGTRFQSL